MPKKRIEPRAMIFPTPLVLVTTVGSDGRPNILTVTCVGIASARPPMVSIAIHPWTYSHSLLEATGEFVVNIPPRSRIEAVKYCGDVSGRDEDKFAGAGLTAVPASEVGAPLIAECPVNLECRVAKFLPLGMHNLFIGEVVAAHVDEEVYPGEDLDVEACDPMSCTKGPGEYRSLGTLLHRHPR